MRFVIQRVKEASVTINGNTFGAIGKGFLVFIGIHESDTREIAERMVKKMLKLRIFEDENGKTNLDLAAVDGSLLLVSQFTLYADCKKGNRPSFVHAGKPELANVLYEYVIMLCQNEGFPVETGQFGADMKVSLVNDGPFTVLLDSDELVQGQ